MSKRAKEKSVGDHVLGWTKRLARQLVDDQAYPEPDAACRLEEPLAKATAHLATHGGPVDGCRECGLALSILEGEGAHSDNRRAYVADMLRGLGAVRATVTRSAEQLARLSKDYETNGRQHYDEVRKSPSCREAMLRSLSAVFDSTHLYGDPRGLTAARRIGKLFTALIREMDELDQSLGKRLASPASVPARGQAPETRARRLMEHRLAASGIAPAAVVRLLPDPDQAVKATEQRELIQKRARKAPPTHEWRKSRPLGEVACPRCGVHALVDLPQDEREAVEYECSGCETVLVVPCPSK